MSKTSRQVALIVLERCRRGGAFSDALLGSLLEETGLDTKNRALAAKLSYGVLQNAILCDFYIDSYSENKKIEPKVRDILRLSVYQTLFLDRIPSHAAVNEGVELCKNCGLKRAAGFVNALLRQISKNKNNLPPIPERDKAEYLSIKYSHPLSLTSLFLSEFGEQFTESLLRANNEPVPTYIQGNTMKTSLEFLSKSLKDRGFNCKPHYFLENCLEISGGNIVDTKEFKDGLFYVQDPAARLVVEAASAKSGDAVLDACAAPGGKSFAAAIQMRNTGSVLSCDINFKRLQLISEGAERLGIGGIISVREMDATRPYRALLGAFDIVIADVPCSGLGVIRKKPDIRYKDISEIEAFPELQLKILSSLSACVKPGGVLMYSTCTILKRENEDLISSFLAENENYYYEDFSSPYFNGKAKSGMLTLFPHIHGTDGFFICRLRRKNED